MANPAQLFFKRQTGFSRLSVKEGFALGALSGAAVAAIFVGLISYLQVQKNFDFATATGDALMAALDDIEALQEKCGERCAEVPLTFKDEMSTGFWKTR